MHVGYSRALKDFLEVSSNERKKSFQAKNVPPEISGF